MGKVADKCLQDIYDTNEMHGMMLSPTLCPRKTSHYQRCTSKVIYLYFIHLYILKSLLTRMNVYYSYYLFVFISRLLLTYKKGFRVQFLFYLSCVNCMNSSMLAL